MSNISDVRKFLDDPTAINLGGRWRTIQFDLNAFGELENRYGTIQAAMEQMQRGKMNDVKVILWAGLIHDEAVFDEITGEVIKYNISPYQVGGWVRPGNLEEVSKKLTIAIGNDLPQQPETPAVAATTEEGVSETATVVLSKEEAEQAKN